MNIPALRAPLNLGSEPRTGISRRRRLFKYQLIAWVTVLASALLAWITAKIWPIYGDEMQGSFFLPLASSVITLFGLVFTLCLIGTQFMATRANVVMRRIFGPGAWLYLLLFLITTLWTLGISYRAGDKFRHAELCKSLLLAKRCFSETQAGRFGIFCVTWSILLLLPFVIYIYRRLTVGFAFSSIATSALRARRQKTFRRRCERLASEILASSSDAKSIDLGLAHLIDLGVSAVKRKRVLQWSNAYSDAHDVTDQFVELSRALVSQPKAVSQVVTR
jgi:hypothetical protein